MADKTYVQRIIDTLPRDLAEPDRLLVEANLWESYGFLGEAAWARAQSEAVRHQRTAEQAARVQVGEMLRVIIDCLEDAYQRMVPS